MLLKLFLILLPWKIRRLLLIKIYGYDIHPKAHIGWSYVYPKHLSMAEGASIANFTIAIHLDNILMAKYSRIGRRNWITGFPTGTNSKFFAYDKTRKSELVLDDNATITKNHHFDCTNSIHLGRFVIIAGYNSQFLTHSINVYNCRQESSPIYIGDYCFVSTRVIILGGSILPNCSVLAAGGILNKAYNTEWTLYAGVPARPKKEISHEAKFFTRSERVVY